MRAFSECLRQELADRPGINVATMLPQAVDTPIFDNAGNYAGQHPRPIPPLLDADEVAQGIIRCAESPAREVTYRRVGRAVELLHSLLPRLYERTVPPGFGAGNYCRRPTADSDGNVLRPAGRHAVDGRWRAERRRELADALVAAADGAARGLFRRR